MDIAQLYQIFKQYPSVQTDTRKIKEGDIFFALKGPHFNGNLFAHAALDAGAAYAIVDDPLVANQSNILLVEDVLETLQQLALHHRKQFSIPFIAITGSNGKTTTKELITTVLNSRFKTYATEGNLNNHIGIPLTLLKIKPDAEIAVIEMGANHQKEIESYCKITLPTHGIITNCGKAHIEGFGGENGVRKGKGELYDFLAKSDGTIFRNTDLPYLKEMSVAIQKQITYGSANAYFIGKALTYDDMFLEVAVLSRNAEVKIATHLVGAFNFPNVMVAIAVGLHFGIGIDDVKMAIEQYQPDNSRSQFIQVKNNSVILDAYNANPTSMKAAIENFATLPAHKKILWLGGMKEMGQAEEKEHQALVELVEKWKWENVVLVGREFKNCIGQYQWFETSALAAEALSQHKPEDATILIKGSRGSKMELLLEMLQKS
ncbi:MAG: UDP-N-acetylmuramoyl-tripeptide--D-alanyl-D-alanine ligase [Bacteroidetes bacterium]|nr:UDP-N-acetylmuramoyl-tripeptide--D-alanyl-D-alanine ligase [Bacteroidota bacterium]MBS1739292.1 UDP-N-acetylmuramoyl-tripeptide--D-alanyl-D-alanine ligase [Bacteroidota bacterium]